MHYTAKLLHEENFYVTEYAYREENPLNYFKHFAGDGLMLATWKMALPLLPTLILSEKKVFIFVHGNDILDFGPALKPFMHYLTRRKQTYFIANSYAVAKLFTKIFNRKIDLVQYPFIDTRVRETASAKKKNRFLTISRLVKRKNIDTVIKAFAKLKGEGFDFHYTIGGSGPEEGRLKRLVHELSLEEDVIFSGHLSEDEKTSHYKKADYFLLPSLFDENNGSIEGYGIVYIEANMYGIPVLSGNTGGMVEAVIDGITGFHTNGTVEDVAAKIVKMTKQSFDSAKIVDHAKKHDYRRQRVFLDFIKEKLHA